MLEMAKGAEFDEGRSIWVVNNAATDEQFEFDKDPQPVQDAGLGGIARGKFPEELTNGRGREYKVF